MKNNLATAAEKIDDLQNTTEIRPKYIMTIFDKIPKTPTEPDNQQNFPANTKLQQPQQPFEMAMRRT